MFDLKNNIQGLNSTWKRIHFNTLLQNIVDIELSLSTGTE